MAPVSVTARDDPDDVHFGSLTGTAATTAAIAVFVACFLVSVICVRVAYIIRTRRGAAGVQPWYAAAIRHVPIGRAQADLEAARGVENHELVDMPAANNNRHYPYGPMPNPVQTIPTPMPTQPQPVYSGMPAAGNPDLGNGRVNFDAYHAAFPNGLRGRENTRENQGRGNTGGSPPPPPPYNTDNGNWDVFSDGSLSPLRRCPRNDRLRSVRHTSRPVVGRHFQQAAASRSGRLAPGYRRQGSGQRAQGLGERDSSSESSLVVVLN